MYLSVSVLILLFSVKSKLSSPYNILKWKIMKCYSLSAGKIAGVQKVRMSQFVALSSTNEA